MRQKSNFGLWVIIVVIIIAAIFYSQKTTDEISVLLTGVQDNLGLESVETAQKSFKWNFKDVEDVKQIEIVGQQLKLEGITGEDYEKIEEYFEDQGFVEDDYNIVEEDVPVDEEVADVIEEGVDDGDVVDEQPDSEVAYKNDQTVCIIRTVTDGLVMDVEVDCGQTDDKDEIEHLFTKTELIQQLFAQKYGKKMSAIDLVFQQETNTHVRGTVSFNDEPKAIGFFWAALVDGEWTLAYDGSRAISCIEMAEYGFPPDMLEGCEDEEDVPETGVN